MAREIILVLCILILSGMPLTPAMLAEATFETIIDVSDYTGETDTERIQAALNDVPPSGAIVVVPEGDWEVANLTGVSNLIFTGRDGTVLRLIEESPIITFKDNYDFVVQNFTIDGANIFGGSGIKVSGTSFSFKIQHNFFQDINRTAINVELNDLGQEISDFAIYNNTFTDCQDATVRLFGITGRRDIERFQIMGNKMTKGFDNGKIAVAFAKDGLIANNEIFDTEHGIATRSVSSITIECNSILNVTGRGLYLGTNIGDVGPNNVTIRKNKIVQANIGLSKWYGASTHSSILVYENMICNSTLLDIKADFPAVFINNTITSKAKLEILDQTSKFMANRDMIGRLIVPTDLNNDLKTDIRDIGIVAKSFGSSEGSANWNPLADIIKDAKIDVKDLCFVAIAFGQTC